MKGRESLRTSSRENSDPEGRHKVRSPRARILEGIQPCDVDMYISPDSYSFQSVYVARYVPGIVPKPPLRALTHLIKFPWTSTISRFMDFSLWRPLGRSAITPHLKTLLEW